jgi:STE24 endopeptidase
MYYGLVCLILLVVFPTGVLIVEGDVGSTLSISFKGSHAYVYVTLSNASPSSLERVLATMFQDYPFTIVESKREFGVSSALVRIPLRGGVLRVNLRSFDNVSVNISPPPYLAVSSIRDDGYIVVSTSLKIHVVLVGLLLVVFGLIMPPLVAYISSVTALNVVKGGVAEAIEIASIPSSLSTLLPALSLIASLFVTEFFEALDYYGIPLALSLISYMVLYMLSIASSLAVALKVFSRVTDVRVSLRDIILASQPLAYVIVSGSALVAGIALVARSAPQIILLFLNLPLPISLTLWILVGFITSYALTTLIARIFDAITPKVEPDERLLKAVEDALEDLGYKGFRRVDVVRSSKPVIAVKGLFGDRLVVSTRLLEILDEEELRYVIAHEIAHSKEKHLLAQIAAMMVLWSSSLIVVSEILLSLLGKLQSSLVIVLILVLLAIGVSAPVAGSLWISRRLEERADMRALALMKEKVGDRRAYLRALAKIAIETQEVLKPRNSVVWKLANLCETHPRTLDRLTRIAKIAGVNEDELVEVLRSSIDWRKREHTTNGS